MKLVCMFTHNSTPNHTMSMPIFSATGPSMGKMMKAISKKSKKKAKKKMKMFTTIKKPTTPPGKPVSKCSTHLAPSTPWNTMENTREPIRMNTTMAVRRMVLCMASQIRSLSKRLWMAAKINAPTQPMAPASVGVAMAVLMPGKPPIEPNTAKIKKAEGMMPRKHFIHRWKPSAVRASLGMPGTCSGLMMLKPKV